MLEHISVENFKALRNADINLGVVTVLIGANGTGKSSVFQTLVVLKQSRGTDELRTDGPHVSLGQYRDIVHNNEETEEICIRLTNLVHEPIEPLFRSESRFFYEAVFDTRGIRSQQGKIELQGAIQFVGGHIARPKAYSTARPKTFEYHGVSFNIKGHSTIALPLRQSGGSFPSEDDKSRIQFELGEKCFGKLFSAINDTLANTYYVPAVRGLSEPSYPLTDGPTQDLSSVGSADLQARHVASTLAYRRDLEAKVSSWTKRVTGTSIEAPIIPKRQVAVEAVVGSRRRMNIVNEGFGTNQLLQPFLQLAIAPSGSLILIEEPEIHIHPAAQNRLCKILVEVAKEERKQVLVTTHSEHILTSLLTSVASHELKAKELAVYFFEKDKDEAKVSPLSVDYRGQVRGGLKGFFEASMDELEEYMKALGRGKGT